MTEYKFLKMKMNYQLSEELREKCILDTITRKKFMLALNGIKFIDRDIAVSLILAAK